MKMKREFNLSEKNTGTRGDLYCEEDIKEFIKKLKELISFCGEIAITKEEMLKGIDKLVGDKLK